MICQGAAGARPAIGRRRARGIDRLDLQAVIGLADQFLERRALQHAVDQLAPVVIGRRRENPPPAAGRRLQTSFAQIAPWRQLLLLAGNCHVAAAKPNACFGPFWSVQVRQPLDSIGR